MNVSNDLDSFASDHTPLHAFLAVPHEPLGSTQRRGAALVFVRIFLLIRLHNNVAKGTLSFGYSLEHWEVFMNF